MDVNWSDDWPDKPGYYWFYGIAHGSNKPELMFVKAWKTANSICLVADGNFLYKSESSGLFALADIPNFPENKR